MRCDVDVISEINSIELKILSESETKSEHSDSTGVDLVRFFADDDAERTLENSIVRCCGKRETMGESTQDGGSSNEGGGGGEWFHEGGG